MGRPVDGFVNRLGFGAVEGSKDHELGPIFGAPRAWQPDGQASPSGGR
jgi:hypothetical protein